MSRSLPGKGSRGGPIPRIERSGCEVCGSDVDDHDACCNDVVCPGEVRPSGVGGRGVRGQGRLLGNAEAPKGCEAQFRPGEDAIGPIDRTERERQQRVNEQIRITPVRVIGPDGAQLGVMPTSKALEAAREAGMDLVEVAASERPPVCKIMDFGKFKYEQKKKATKQKQHQIQVKEIRVRPKTGEEDIRVKVKRAREFLEHKDKVLVNVLFRGRELAHIDEGRRVMEEVLAMLEDVAKVEKTPSMEGRRMTAIVAPRS